MTVGFDVRYVVAGAGGMGREALAWACDAWPTAHPVGFWVAQNGHSASQDVAGLPVFGSLAELQNRGVTHVVLGIGDNRRRHDVAGEAADGGLKILTVIHPTAFVGPNVAVGSGAIIAPGVVLTRDIEVGPGAIINYQAAAGHGCRIGPWTFVGPASALAGDVTVEEKAMVGIGAVILPRRTVGVGGTVGGGAVVVKDVPAGRVVTGNPARPLIKRAEADGGSNS